MIDIRVLRIFVSVDLVAAGCFFFWLAYTMVSQGKPTFFSFQTNGPFAVLCIAFVSLGLAVVAWPRKKQ
jgi:hypothetical protein